MKRRESLTHPIKPLPTERPMGPIFQTSAETAAVITQLRSAQLDWESIIEAFLANPFDRRVNDPGSLMGAVMELYLRLSLQEISKVAPDLTIVDELKVGRYELIPASTSMGDFDGVLVYDQARRQLICELDTLTLTQSSAVIWECKCGDTRGMQRALPSVLDNLAKRHRAISTIFPQRAVGYTLVVCSDWDFTGSQNANRFLNSGGQILALPYTQAELAKQAQVIGEAAQEKKRSLLERTY